MPYRKTKFLKGRFYHLFSRGDRKEPIFLEDKDYQRFLEKLEEYRKNYGVGVIGYCLLSNHLHLLVKQLTDVPLSKFMGILLNSHARYLATKYQLPTGHVFQGQFGAKTIESEEGLLQVSRYIHLNPVKEELLNAPHRFRRNLFRRNLTLAHHLRSYPWSSYITYLQPTLSGPVTLEILPVGGETSKTYREFVEAKISPEDADYLSQER